MEDYLKAIIPTAISLIAAIFSILTYRRNRRIENENYIFKIKQENYAKILSEINRLINELQEYIIEFRSYLKEMDTLSNERLKELEEEINKMADEVDDLIFKFDDSVITNSLVIPKNVLDKLEEFSDKLFDSELPENVDENQEELLAKLDDHVSELIRSANDINDLLRSDLKVEELNTSLYRRLKR